MQPVGLVGAAASLIQYCEFVVPVRSHQSFHQSHRAMTLVEIIIVVALLAGVMAYAIPSMLKPQDHSGFFRQFQAEIKSAFDTAVLTSSPLRLVIQPAKAAVHLESVPHEEAAGFSLASLWLDESQSSQVDRRRARAEQFSRWTADLPHEVRDHFKDRIIAPRSPLLDAKHLLIGPEWQPVQSYGHEPFQWSPQLRLRQYYIEHLATPVSIADEVGEHGPIHLHFLPQGYVEKATFVFREDAAPERPPYVVVVHPHQGIATLTAELEAALIYTASY